MTDVTIGLNSTERCPAHALRSLSRSQVVRVLNEVPRHEDVSLA